MDLNSLNDRQREAVETTEGPLLILAGAGSGKTRVLTYRIAYLIYEKNVRPWHILAITFTNKAAREMRERVEKLVEIGADEVWISTFHSMCVKILRREIDKLGYTRNFSIYDDDDQITLIKELLRKNNISDKDYPPRMLKSVISDAKNKMQSPDEFFNASSRGYRDQIIHNLYAEYDEKLKINNALDFDDLLLKTLELFAMHPPVLDAYCQRFRYVHVDEYQDTNSVQYMLVKLLSSGNGNLCVVGDDDQSIYGWRGADIRNILDFEKDFPNTNVIKLEQNYRSTNAILEAANQVIAHNSSRKDKRLWSSRQEGELLTVYAAIDDHDEAAWLARQIRALNEKGYKNNEIGILYRLNSQSRLPEETLVRGSIPYRIWGGLRFYDRKEIKDVIAYMRAIANPNDDISLRRIINEPKRAIGRATVEELTRAALETGQSMFETVMSGEGTELASRAKAAVAGFAETMNELILQSELMPLVDFVSYLLDKTGLMAQYKKEKTDEARAKVENLEELAAAVKEYVDSNSDATIESFLENVALVSDIDGLTDENSAVTLMTVHSAKGLEFTVVFVLGMEEGSFPHQRALMDDEQMEEERRLCYVAMTRAKDLLFLSHAQRRFVYEGYRERERSRFIGEIPVRLINGGEKPRRTQKLQKSAGDMFWDDISQRLAPRQAAVKQKPNINNIPGVQKGTFVPSIARAAQTPPSTFEKGDRVSHSIFGDGVVIKTREVSGDSYITVNFVGFGIKELSASIAKLSKKR